MFSIDLEEPPGKLPSIHIGKKYADSGDSASSALVDRLISATKETEGVLQALAANYRRSDDKARVSKYITELFEIAVTCSEAPRIAISTSDPSSEEVREVRRTERMLQDANLKLALIRINGLRQNITLLEAGRIKNLYVAKLGSCAALFSAILIIPYLVLRYSVFTDPIPEVMRVLGIPEGPDASVNESILVRHMNFFLLVGASFVGAWLSFSIRKVELGFFDLAALEKDRLVPVIRLLFVGGLTFTIGLALSANLVFFRAGEMSSNFLASGKTALLLGLLCGVIEAALSTIVGRQATLVREAMGSDPDTAVGVGSQSSRLPVQAGHEPKS